MVEVEAHLGENVGTVFVDPGQLGQVIVNLAVNARDAMEAGGRLTIETSSVSLAEVDTGKHFDLAAGRYALFSITDSGSGIEPAVVDKIFDPFFTTKPLGAGTGLGLSTVLGIVKQSGGAVSVYSEPGVGTTFKIYLPEHDIPAPNLVDSPEEADTARGERILVVDDAGSVRDYVAAVLTDTGYDVTTAATPGEALRLAAEQDFHLLISDVVMPEASGPELIARIRRERPGMRAVLMSGYAGESLREIGAEFPYLQKPFTMSDLKSTIRAALAARD